MTEDALPMFAELHEDEQKRVVTAIAEFYNHLRRDSGCIGEG
jgi:dTDP-4-amino-4,6-dideoxygalactose transaminase